MADAQIVLIVDGILLQDDAGVIAGIHARLGALQALMGTIHTQIGGLMSELSNALDSLQTSLDTLVTEVEELLTMPNPDVALALQRLGSMKTAVDAEVQKIRDAEQPPPTP